MKNAFVLPSCRLTLIGENHGNVMRPFLLLLSLLVLPALSGCDAIIGIFEVGAWVGVVAAVVLIVIVGFLFSKFGKGPPR